jgi:hypothetical protein
MAMASMFACTRAESTAAFCAAKVIAGVLFTIVVSQQDTTRMLLMLGFTAKVPVLGHAANALSARVIAKPAAPAAAILRKSRLCFCMKDPFLSIGRTSPIFSLLHLV